LKDIITESLNKESSANFYHLGKAELLLLRPAKASGFELNVITTSFGMLIRLFNHLPIVVNACRNTLNSRSRSWV
jgi:hypothetical protein